MPQRHIRPAGMPPVNGYSHAVVYAGHGVAVSGQVPLDADGVLVGADDPEQQIEQVFANLRLALAAAGTDLEHVVKLTVFLTDRADLPAYRRVRDRHIDVTAPPASSLIIVAGLVDPAFRVEVEALAVAP